MASILALPLTVRRGILAVRGKGSTLGDRILHGISWQLGLSILGRTLTFPTALIQTHLLGREGYGELGMVLSTMMLFGLISTATGGQTSTKYIAELRYSDPERAGRIASLSLMTTLVFSIIAVSLLLLSSDLVATKLLGTPRLSGLLTLSAVAMSIQAFSNTFCGMLLGLQLYTTEAVVRFIQLPVWLGMTALLTARFGVLGALVAFTLSHTAGLTAAAFAVWRAFRAAGLKFRLSGLGSERGVLASYSGPLLLHSILFVPTNWACNAVLARQPSGFAALGSYTASVQFRSAAILLPLIVQTVVWPILSEMRGAGQTERFNRLYGQAMSSLWALTLAIAVTLTMFQKPLMALFGRGFSQDHVVFGLSMACAPVMLAASFTCLALQSLEKTWPALYSNVAYSLTSLGLTVAFAPTHGAAGMAVAFIASTAVQFASMAALMRRYSTAMRFGRDIATMAGSIGIAVAATLVTAAQFQGRLPVQILVTLSVLSFAWKCRPAWGATVPAGATRARAANLNEP